MIVTVRVTFDYYHESDVENGGGKFYDYLWDTDSGEVSSGELVVVALNSGEASLARVLAVLPERTEKATKYLAGLIAVHPDWRDKLTLKKPGWPVGDPDWVPPIDSEEM